MKMLICIVASINTLLLIGIPSYSEAICQSYQTCWYITIPRVDNKSSIRMKRVNLEHLTDKPCIMNGIVKRKTINDTTCYK